MNFYLSGKQSDNALSSLRSLSGLIPQPIKCKVKSQVTWSRTLPALCPRFRQFACFFFEFSFYKVLSNKAMHLPRSVRSSHWSKASIVWIKNKSNQTISHSYLCKSRSSEEKVERKVTDADKNFTVSTPYA